MLTAFPMPGSEWRDEGADEMLVKPMNTQDLLRQLEALLVTHEDKKQAVKVPTSGDLLLKSRRKAAAGRAR